MRIAIDLNVVLDVVQQRQPHYRMSAGVMSRVRKREIDGIVPAHALTTIDYLLTRYADAQQAGAAVDWLLDHFEVVTLDKPGFRRARSLVRSGGMKDFEDAVVAVSAEHAECEYVVTRNLVDFEGSPVATCSPAELLDMV